MYAYGRNAIEGFNSNIKGESGFDLSAAAASRRPRGLTAQRFLLTIGIAAANMMLEREARLLEGAAGTALPDAHRRLSRKSSARI